VQACTWFNKDYLGFRSTQNCEGDDADLGGDDDGDVVVDDDEETSPHAKGLTVMMMVSNYPRSWPRSSRFCPLPEKKRAFASDVALEKSIKLGHRFFHDMEVS
jgi:hypothetical protein